MMRIGWIGFHVEGLPALRTLIEDGAKPVGLITLRPELAAKRSGAGDYHDLCRRYGIPLYEVANINDPESLALLRRLSLDLVFVIGWTQIVGPEALRSARLGMIGAHASLLPSGRGRAPINWALIKGLPQTGNTLIWLDEGVDSGELIDQTVIDISPYDTCATLYEKVADSNREMIRRALPLLLAGEKPGRPQPRTDEPPLPGRRPQDGLLDWSRKAAEVYDFLRALTRPYPGAFGWLDHRRWTIWRGALLPPMYSLAGVPPGQVIGPVVSPDEGACGQVVACGHGGAVLLTELEDESGEELSGRRLSDQDWTGKVWASGR